MTPATRTPLIVRLPGEKVHESGAPNSGKRCRRPVSVVDLYPTLIDLCGLPQRDDLDGRSIAPLVHDPTTEWPYPAIITHLPHLHGVNHVIRSQQHDYIRYRDGGEELYDMNDDPNQWRNLVKSPTHVDTKRELRKWLPNTNAEHFQSE